MSESKRIRTANQESVLLSERVQQAAERITTHLAPVERRATPRPGFLDRIARRIFFRVLSKLEHGRLVIEEVDGTSRAFGPEDAPLQARMVVADTTLYRDILTGGELNLGLGYVNQKWESESVYRVVLILLLNVSLFRSPVRFSTRWLPYGRKLRAKLDRSLENTIEHNKTMVGITYDVGNDFQRWMIGRDMQYSSAIWAHPEQTYDEAQRNKMEKVVGKLRVEPHHRVLEVGCGWGQLSHLIYESSGASVKGIALSREQIEYARENYPGCEFVYQDYRELDPNETFDRIVTVGMVTHVGRNYLNTYLKTLASHLRPGGRLVLHTMMYNDGVFFVDGRTKFPTFPALVMPNSDAVSHGDLARAAMATGELRVVHSETFGVHYARTGQHWLANLVQHKEQVIQRYSERHYRAYYYAWSMGSAAMETGTTLVQMVFEKQPYGSPFTHSML
ncbi:MAG: class I SAM-dependent methyltransferase [Deltaproteobacteria bacterium]|nr:MAG: class I SAM-dependent methyltransferase [Deltaproteobacteria bacterium]